LIEHDRPNAEEFHSTEGDFRQDEEILDLTKDNDVFIGWKDIFGKSNFLNNVCAFHM
jgi:hypothetical protein